MPEAKVQANVPRQSTLLKFYHQYEYLAEQYARKIYRSGKIGLDYDDLVQEFRLKIYLTIIAYSRYYERKKQSRYQPWPMLLYIQRALHNKSLDFMKQISETPDHAYSVEQDGFDYSEFGTRECNIEWGGN